MRHRTCRPIALPRPTTHRLLAAAALCAAGSTASATLVSIVDVTGANAGTITTTPPNPITQNPNNGILLAWDEKQNVTLQEKLYVDRVFDPAASFIGSDSGGTFISAGTVVSSHYLQWDPGNGSGTRVNATIKLDSQAFAFITADQKLFNSDVIVGLDNFDYADFNLRGLEGGDTTNFNGPDVDISWAAGSPGDWTRLITAFSPSAAPELTTNSDPLTAATVDFGLTRVGTTSTADLTLTNSGGSQPAGLTGSVAAVPLGAGFAVQGGDPNFGPIAEGASATKTFAFTPLARGINSFTDAIVTSNDTEDTSDTDATVTLTGEGVGPDAGFLFDDQAVSDSDTLDFGTLESFVPDEIILSLEIANNTTDSNGGDDALTDLTLLDIQIDGIDSDVFSVMNFTPGTVVSKGDSIMIDLVFAPDAVEGLFDDATLTLETDQGAALGSDGLDFVFSLQGESIVPEPTSLLLLATGGLLAIKRRRRA